MCRHELHRDAARPDPRQLPHPPHLLFRQALHRGGAAARVQALPARAEGRLSGATLARVRAGGRRDATMRVDCGLQFIPFFWCLGGSAAGWPLGAGALRYARSVRWRGRAVYGGRDVGAAGSSGALRRAQRSSGAGASLRVWAGRNESRAEARRAADLTVGTRREAGDAGLSGDAVQASCWAQGDSGRHFMVGSAHSECGASRSALCCSLAKRYSHLLHANNESVARMPSTASARRCLGPVEGLYRVPRTTPAPMSAEGMSACPRHTAL